MLSACRASSALARAAAASAGGRQQHTLLRRAGLLRNVAAVDCATALHPACRPQASPASRWRALGSSGSSACGRWVPAQARRGLQTSRSLTQEQLRRQQGKQPNKRLRVLGALLAAGGGLYVYNHIDRAPYTGRRRLIVTSPETERMIAEVQAEQMKKELANKILPANHPASITLRRVAQRLMPGVAEEVPAALKWDWEFYVVDDPATVNAFCMAGGKVFVFTGLFKAAPTEGLLAAVVGHEIGHALARHHAEHTVTQLSKALLFVTGLLVGMDMESLSMLGFVTSLGLELPKSRKLELEADAIGMRLLACSCIYEPQDSILMLSRLSNAVGDRGGVLTKLASYANTHPCGEDRIAAAKAQLPAALAEMRSHCPELAHALHERRHHPQHAPPPMARGG